MATSTMTIDGSRLSRFTSLLERETVGITAEGGSKTYHVHTGIFEGSGSALEARLGPNWKTSDNELVDWNEFDCQTIECVLQYFYFGDYVLDVEQGELACMKAEEARPKVSNPPILRSQFAVDPFAHDNDPSKPATNVKNPNAQTAASAPVSEAKGSSVSGTGLQCHAKIFTFAHLFRIDALAKLAAGQLKNGLDVAEIETLDTKESGLDSHFANIVEEVFNNTAGSQSQIIKERLARFAVTNYGVLSGINDLLSKGGDFPIYFAAIAHTSKNKIQDRLLDAIDAGYKVNERQRKKQRMF